MCLHWIIWVFITLRRAIFSKSIAIRKTSAMSIKVLSHPGVKRCYYGGIKEKWQLSSVTCYIFITPAIVSCEYAQLDYTITRSVAHSMIWEFTIDGVHGLDCDNDFRLKAACNTPLWERQFLKEISQQKTDKCWNWSSFLGDKVSKPAILACSWKSMLLTKTKHRFLNVWTQLRNNIFVLVHFC